MKNYFFIFILFLSLFLGDSEKSFSATYTVGTAGNYATLKAAFDDINAGNITGAITLNVISNTTEPTPGTNIPNMILNASGAGAANYSSVLIQPSGGAWTISGTGYSSTLQGLMLINGSNVTIDGLNTGGNSLAIKNIQTNNYYTVKFGSSNTNKIQNSTLTGSYNLGAWITPSEIDRVIGGRFSPCGNLIRGTSVAPMIVAEVSTRGNV